MNDSESDSLSFWCQFISDNSKFEANKSESKLIQHGFNEIYQIETNKGKKILRVSLKEKAFQKSKDNYLYELNLLEYLHLNKLQVSRPIEWNNNSFLNETEQVRGSLSYCSLFEYADGKVFDPLNASQRHKIGIFLAKFHELTKNYKSDHQPLVWNAETLISDSISKFKQNLAQTQMSTYSKLEDIAKWAKVMINEFESPYGVIHGDIRSFNIHFTEKGEFTVFDFDFTGIGPLLLDLATFIGMEREFVRLYEPERYVDLDYNVFLAGYNSELNLTKYELEYIPVFEVIRWLSLYGSWAELIVERGSEISWDSNNTVEYLLQERINFFITHMEFLIENCSRNDFNYYNLGLTR